MKKRITILILLLLIAAAGFWLLKKPKTTTIKFTLQGQTEINPGPVIMKVWDHDAEDGDTIRVFFDGKLIADTLAILNTPIEYKLGKLSAGEHLIGVVAINEGISAPASAYISLNDGSGEKEFSMDAFLDSAASWKLIVK